MGLLQSPRFHLLLKLLSANRRILASLSQCPDKGLAVDVVVTLSELRLTAAQFETLPANAAVKVPFARRLGRETTLSPKWDLPRDP